MNRSDKRKAFFFKPQGTFMASAASRNGIAPALPVVLMVAALFACTSMLKPGQVAASEFTGSASLKLEPQSGSFFNNAFRSANLSVQTGVSAPNPPSTSLLPTKVTTINLPTEALLRFNPGDMPVCPDSQIGPQTNNSVTIENIVAKCPNSIVGNGRASFLLNRINNPLFSPPRLDAFVIVFNGGLEGGRPNLKFWAFSYDTQVAIYTEAVLSEEGQLRVPIPQLTSDSAVNSLSFEIPGDTTEEYLPNQVFNVTIPGGQRAGYVQAKCATGSFPFSTEFVLGRRQNDGTPFGEEVSLTGGSPAVCSGIPRVFYGLSVSKSGTGTGSIVSDSEGISCGSSCQAEFDSDTVVTLTADPNEGSIFGGWSGACSNQSGDCVVNMSQARNVSATFTLLPVPPPGPVGISINRGAQYTNSSEVEINLVWPFGNLSALLANDGGFQAAQPFDLQPTIPWTLDSSGPERLPKTVYLRFGDSNQTFSDDIILDETSPVVRSASAQASGSRTLLKVAAVDPVSGVASVQAGPSKSPQLKRVAYSSKITVPGKAKKIWLRVNDRAGNSSNWISRQVKRR
jgi:hypothetical protein